MNDIDSAKLDCSSPAQGAGSNMASKSTRSGSEAVRRLEELRTAYDRLRTEQIRAEGEAERLEQELAVAKAEARAEFGTDDEAALAGLVGGSGAAFAFGIRGPDDEYCGNQPADERDENKDEVYRGRPAQEQARPDQAEIPVDLAAGTHRVTVEVQYRGDRSALFARFFDPDRKLVWK